MHLHGPSYEITILSDLYRPGAWDTFKLMKFYFMGYVQCSLLSYSGAAQAGRKWHGYALCIDGIEHPLQGYEPTQSLRVFADLGL